MSGTMWAVVATVGAVTFLIVLMFSLLMMASRTDDEAEAEMEAYRVRQRMRDAALRQLGGDDDAA